MNFWGLLLQAVIGLINWLQLGVFGGAKHEFMGLAAVIGYNAYVILEVTYVTLGTFNLTFAFITLGISLAMWVIRLAVGVYLFFKKLIPFA